MTNKNSAGGDLQGDRFLLMYEEFVAGILFVQTWDETMVQAVFEPSDDVVNRITLYGARIGDAFEAYGEYLELVEKEGENSHSQKLIEALERVERGEVGTYLMPDEWRIVDENRFYRTIKEFAVFTDRIFQWVWGSGKTEPLPDNGERKIFEPRENLTRFRLELRDDGRHVFGGRGMHEGIHPAGSDVALHHFLTLDLKDLRSPFFYSPGCIRYLPLYYPLAYGGGGAEIQYAADSDKEIRIIYMSDMKPDGKDAYVKVSQLPEIRADIVPLKYEETRARVMEDHHKVCGLSRSDSELLKKIGGWQAIYFGGSPHPNSGDVCTCKNPECDLGKTQSSFKIEPLISIPPVPINGETAFWYEYESPEVEFCFCLCPECRNVIAFNVCY